MCKVTRSVKTETEYSTAYASEADAVRTLKNCKSKKVRNRNFGKRPPSCVRRVRAPVESRRTTAARLSQFSVTIVSGWAVLGMVRLYLRFCAGVEADCMLGVVFTKGHCADCDRWRENPREGVLRCGETGRRECVLPYFDLRCLPAQGRVLMYLPFARVLCLQMRSTARPGLRGRTSRASGTRPRAR